MSNRSKESRSRVPTVALAVDEFIERERVAGKKAIRDLESILRGPTKLMHGKVAAGPALAKSELGQLGCNRLSAGNVSRWFGQRCPTSLAPATRKRAMSALRGFLKYCISQGWCDSSVLAACVSIPDSPPRREWLTPEQVVAVSELVEDPNEFDDYDQFAIAFLRDSGVRTEEAITSKCADLDVSRKVLHVTGKGRGAGKPREIPVDDEFIALWRSHAKRFDIGPNGWVLFARQARFVGGSTSVQQWTIDKTRHTGQKPLRRITRKLGQLAREQLQPELAPGFDLTPKVFRRSYACTHVILHAFGLGGLDLISLQDAMGHERLDTTRVYLSDVKSYLNRIRRRVNIRTGAREILKLQDGDSAIQ